MSIQTRIQLIDKTTAGVLTGKVAADFPQLYWLSSPTGGAIAITLVNLSSILSTYQSGGIFEEGAGWYRLDLPPEVDGADGDRIVVAGEDSAKFVYHPPIERSLLTNTGPRSVILTFIDENDDPVPFAEFVVQGRGRGRANNVGIATIGLVAGSYTLTTRDTAGVLFEDLDFSVAGGGPSPNIEVQGEGLILTTPTDPSQSVGTLRCYTNQGDADADAIIRIQLQDEGDAGAWPSNATALACNVTGDLLDPVLLTVGVRHVRLRTYRAWRGDAVSDPVEYLVPDEDSFEMPALLGRD